MSNVEFVRRAVDVKRISSSNSEDGDVHPHTQTGFANGERTQRALLGDCVAGSSEGDFCLRLMMSWLTPKELCAVACAASQWRACASDSALWRPIIDQLWKGKVYVPRYYVEQRDAGRLKEAYFRSLLDSTRDVLTQEELTSFDWRFRFKLAAGVPQYIHQVYNSCCAGWTNQDPWHNGREASRTRFGADGVIVSAQHLGDITLRWRFVRSVWGMPQCTDCPKGRLLRARVNGMDVPTYVVSRCPINWGFIMQSCWALYTSFDMPPRSLFRKLTETMDDQDPDATVRGGPVAELDPETEALLAMLSDDGITVDDQWEEAMRFNMGIPNTHAEFGQTGGDPTPDDRARSNAIIRLPDGRTLVVPANMFESFLHQMLQMDGWILGDGDTLEYYGDASEIEGAGSGASFGDEQQDPNA